MNIRFIPNKSMKQFHENENIQKLVSICIENYHTSIFDDVILLLSSKHYNEILQQLEEKYYDTNEFGIFLSYKQCILNIYGDEHVKNLKGAFLEVLSFKIFYNNFNPYYYSNDCLISIDGWQSEKTVDIAMLYNSSALACECKVPASKFNWDIFRNLLEIKLNGDFDVYAITLDNKIRMDKKIQKIIFNVPECDSLDDILVITRDNFNIN